MNEDLMNDLIEVIWPYLDKKANEHCGEKGADWDSIIKSAKGDVMDALHNAMDGWSSE